MGFVLGKREKIQHLLYMDDLKIYASNDNQLESLLNTVKNFSDDIRMKFGLDKCNKLSIIRGKLSPGSGDVILNENEKIDEL